jgi:hypothetical protein
MTTAVGAGSLFRVGLAVNSAPQSLPAPGSDTFRTVAYVTSVTPPGFVKKVIEEPTLSDGTLQFGGGLEGQSLEVSYVRDFTDAPHEDLFSDGRNNINQFRNFRLLFSDAGTEQWDFRGFVSTFQKEELTSEQAVKVSLTIRVFGVITVTP